VVQLKRFGYGWSRKQKIKDRVAVPLSLSLKEVMSSEAGEEETLYRLKSTVEHAGEMNFGHYTGHVYSEKDEKWF
jgi:ubiquitin C-terminal hydrolase